MLEDRDWDLVTDQLALVIREVSDRDVVRLLDALTNALDIARDSREADLYELVALATVAARAATRRCDRRAGPIELDLIEAWFWLGGRLPEQNSAPRLARTWTELLPSTTIDLTVPGELDQAIAWLRLVELLGQHAPDQLLIYGFPERHDARIEALVGQADRLLDTRRGQIAAQRLVQLLRLCRRQGAIAPQTRASCDQLIHEAGGDVELPVAPDYSDRSVRRHVERILEDL